MKRKTSKEHNLYLLPGITYKYISNPKIDVYSAIKMGILHKWQKKEYPIPPLNDSWDFSYQVELAGINVKYKRFGFFSELGFGSTGIFKMGVSYKL